MTAQHTTAPEGQRVVVIFEPGPGGGAAVDFARELAEHEHASLTVVSIVPQGASGARCGNSARDYNLAIRDAADRELRQAREQLGEIGDRATFKQLIEGADPPLHEWIAAWRFDVILLPARRRPLRAAKHPEALRLGRSTGAEVRVVGPQARRPESA